MRYGYRLLTACSCSGYNKLVNFHFGQFGHVLVEPDYAGGSQCFGSVIVIVVICVDSKDLDE